MTEPSLPELEAERDRLYAQLSMVGDFRRGSVTENYRKCGKPNCACAAPDHPGHGPRFLWTRSAGRGKTIGRQLAGGRGGEGARRGGPAWRVHRDQRADRGGEREDLRGQARGRHGCALPRRGAKRGALRGARAGESRRDRPPGGGRGQVAGLRRCRAGGGRGGDPGRDAAGWAAACWSGCWPPTRATAARGCRAGRATRRSSLPTGTRVIDTVLGPVTLTRAWYHCAACRHGFAPRDAELGVAGVSMSPGWPR